MKKRVAIIDDHASICQMLGSILAEDPAYDVVAMIGSGLKAVEVCTLKRPDLVILDLVLPELSGLEVLRRLSLKVPAARVLVFSGTSDHRLILQSLKYRPKGFVEKSESWKIFREAIHAVSSGSSYFSPLASKLLYDAIGSLGPIHLSSREREVLQMIAEGHTSKEIATRLNVATRTVENHRAHLMEKLNLHNTAGLTRYAMKHGLVQMD